MGLTGNLKTVSFPDILQLLATGKKTGTLQISTNSRQKEIVFEDGNIIFASSINASEDLLGNLLLKRGKISKSDLEQAIALHKQTGRQLGTTLVDMNLFEKDEVIECLKMQIEEIVYNLFSWPEGEFKFAENAMPKSMPMTVELSTMSVIMEGTRRIDEWVEIEKVLPPDDVKLMLTKAPGTHAEPAQVFHAIADMGDFPVEHGANAFGADDKVAVAKISVHQAQRCVLRQVLLQPAKGQFKGGVILGARHGCFVAVKITDAIHQIAVVIYQLPHRHPDHARWQNSRLDGVQTGQYFPALVGHGLARLRKRRVAQNAWSQHFAFDAVHHIAIAQGVIPGDREVDFGHQTTGLVDDFL